MSFNINDRIVVVSPADKDCDHAIMWGSGFVTDPGPEMTEVHFDNGSGGNFPNAWVRPEPRTWVEVANHLRSVGWQTEFAPVTWSPACPYQWTSPAGRRHRGQDSAVPPESVMREAFEAGAIGFLHLVAMQHDPQG